MVNRRKTGPAVRGAQKTKKIGNGAVNLDLPSMNQLNSMDPVFVFEEAQMNSQMLTEPTLARSARKGRPKRPQAIKRKAPPSGRPKISDPVIGNSVAGESSKNHYEARMHSIEQNMKHLASTMEKAISNISEMMSQSGTGNPSLADMREDLKTNNYKNKYILAQETNGELHSENRELRSKLETTLARVEGYEKGQQVLCETIGRLKDASYVDCLAKTVERALGGGSSLGAFHNNDTPAEEALPTAIPSAGRNATQPRQKAVYRRR